MALLGLDIGTTGCKAIVFDVDGNVRGQGAREYAVATPHPRWAEQDAEAVWQCAWNALAEAVAGAEGHPVRALALSVQGEAVIPVDAEGHALRPAILGMDTRTGAENTWISERFGAETLFARTGMPVATVNTLPKLLWLRRHEPEVWKRAHAFLLYEDFFLRRLGGAASISRCLASRTQMYDLRSDDWANDILDACAIERERLAPLAPPDGGVVGSMTAKSCSALGIDNDVLLVSGGHDQACAALGSGVVAPGVAMVSTGTAEVVEVAMEAPALDVRLRDAGISVYRHVVPGLFLAMTLNHGGGLLLRWFRDRFCEVERARARSEGKDAYDLILASAPDGPTGVMVLPHLSGAGTPHMDASSKCAILGLTLASDRATIAKAALEGLTFELRVNLDLLAEGGVAIGELRAVGGGARSPLWLQLKADICNVPIRVPHVTEAACLGAALLAGVGAGIYPDCARAAAHVVTATTRYTPVPAEHAAYAPRYSLYRRLYPELIELLRAV